MTKFQIWAEGYQASGDYSGADHLGSIEAETFQEACDKFFALPENIEHSKLYNSKNLSWWGCKLFDNETDARKNFG